MNRKENHKTLEGMPLKSNEVKAVYKKEILVARSIVSCALYYAIWPEEKKKNLKERLAKLNLITLGFILEELTGKPEFLELFYLVEEYYISHLAVNGVQKRFLKESLENYKDNYQKVSSGTKVTIDTYNYGKRCGKFSRRKSGKKSKGKAFARVRVKEVSFS